VGVKVTAALAACAMVIGVRVAASAVQAGAAKTTKDKIYSSAQATRGEAIYMKLCDTCHDPAKVKPGVKGGPVLSGDVFLTKWDGKDLDELLDEIEMNMPNDGSAVLDDKQTADVTAYILKTNAMPDGASDLVKGAGSKGITIAK
jgi:mono/diheme cytochrome c family protein